jgi:hypothetical protein
LTSIALTSAALGLTPRRTRNDSRTTAAQPETSGVAIDVPASNMYSGSGDAPQMGLAEARLDLAERMTEPGATISGLIRWSRVGPRLLKAATPSGLFETRSEAMGLTGKRVELNLW